MIEEKLGRAYAEECIFAVYSWLTIEIVKANMQVFKLAMTWKGFDEVAHELSLLKPS